MSDDRLADLGDRWLNGTATDDEIAELRTALRDDPRRLRRLFATLEFEDLLQEALHPDAAAPAGCERPSARLRPSRRRRAIRARVPSPFVWIALSAAALLMVVVLLRVGGGTASPSQTVPAIAKEPPAIPRGLEKPAPTSPVAAPTSPLGDHVPAAEVIAKTTPAPTPSTAPIVAVAPDTPSAAQQIPPPTKEPLVAETPALTPPVAVAVAMRAPRRHQEETGTLSDGAAAGLAYLLLVPKPLPERRELGLILSFHGNTGNQSHISPPILSSLEKHGWSGEWLVASVKSRGDYWGDADDQAALDTMSWLLRTYPIDPRRVVTMGVSQGGWMAGWFALRHPERIAGAAVLCASTLPVQKLPAGVPWPALFIAHGGADVAEPVKGSRATVELLRQAGAVFAYREPAADDHLGLVYDGAIGEQAAAWLHGLRHLAVPAEPDDERFAARFLRRDEDALWRNATALDELVRIGGTPAARAMVAALRSRTPSVRIGAATVAGRLGGLDAALVGPLSGLLEDTDAQVRTAAITALGQAAFRQHDAALIALGRYALTRAHPLDERVLAVRALGIPRLLDGFPGDRALVDLLVTLLDDAQPPMRSAAIGVLAGITGDAKGYDPQLAPKEQADALMRWRRWWTERWPATK